MHGQNNIKFVC